AASDAARSSSALARPRCVTVRLTSGNPGTTPPRLVRRIVPIWSIPRDRVSPAFAAGRGSRVLKSSDFEADDKDCQQKSAAANRVVGLFCNVREWAEGTEIGVGRGPGTDQPIGPEREKVPGGGDRASPTAVRPRTTRALNRGRGAPRRHLTSQRCRR